MASEKEFINHMQNYIGSMKGMLESVMFGNKSTSFMLRINDNATDMLAYECAHLEIDRGTKEQYMEDIQVLYNNFDKIICSMRDLKGVWKEYGK